MVWKPRRCGAKLASPVPQSSEWSSTTSWRALGTWPSLISLSGVGALRRGRRGQRSSRTPVVQRLAGQLRRSD
eukprot:5490345-Pyramimonas_sp.AAC.1